MAKRQTPLRLTVRMYRDILGDCFLLRISEGARTVNVLVDCGILQGMPDATARAERIMADIASTTGNVLDVLIVTHEHWDHLSGFHQAKAIFDGIEVKELWLAWTEDDRDELARKMRDARRQALAVVQRSNEVATRLAAGAFGSEEDDPDDASDDRPAQSFAFSDLLDFFGPLDLAARPTTGGILQELQRKAERVRLFRPGLDPVPVAGLKSFRAYILGPPRDEALLKRSNPRKSKSEVYELGAGGLDDMFFLAALAADGLGAAAPAGLSRPFGDRWLLRADPPPMTPTTEEAAALDFHRRVYGDPNEGWRRIDEDWLLSGEQLALKLDSDTNNTSLAIAFEVGEGAEAKVLLFPGDAQVGNWLSWGELRGQPVPATGHGRAATVEDLLARTVLYKVGHHGSHNATLRERGLELMTSRDLVAMIPVHEDFARGKKHWNMPFPSLLKRLNEKTARRVIRADRARSELADELSKFQGKAGELTGAEQQRFLDAVQDIEDEKGPLAIEYAIEL